MRYRRIGNVVEAVRFVLGPGVPVEGTPFLRWKLKCSAEMGWHLWIEDRSNPASGWFVRPGDWIVTSALNGQSWPVSDAWFRHNFEPYPPGSPGSPNSPT